LKVRVYQLSRELKVSSEALVNVASSLGVEVKSHMSALEEDVVQRIRDKFAEERAKVKREFVKKEHTQEPAPRQVETPAPRPPAAPPETAPQPPSVEPSAPEPGPSRPHRVPSREPLPRPVTERPMMPVRRPVSPAPRRIPRSGPGVSLGLPGRSGSQLGARLRPPKKRKRKRGAQPNQEAVRESVRRTMHMMDSGGRRSRRRRRGGAVETEDQPSRVLKVHEFASVGELASLMEVKPTQVIATCLQMGIIANINKQLDKDEISAILDEYDFEPDFVAEFGAEMIHQEEVEDEGEYESRPRAPIVTVMGHVDHGKTTLLDYIRKTRVTEQESGGITQHIGAYRVEHEKGTICFLDTPGHEAFSAMRARGAQATDAVVLVVAANDEVRPQTIEAINHAKAAEVPIIVAINKIDVPGANPDNIRKGLSDAGVLVEEWGGQTVCVEISAKHGTNIDKLLEMILLVAELQDLKTEPGRPARGVVIESQRDAGKGVVATVLVQNGTLRVSDPFVCGAQYGKVRAMADENGRRVKEVGSSTPVEVLGWSGVPNAGDVFAVVHTELKAREIAGHRTQIARLHEHRLARQVTSLASIQERIQRGELQELNVVVKADVGGSVEVLRDRLESLSTDEVKVRVIHQGVGLINESDVLLALASKAIILGFHTRPDAKAHQLALTENVDIRLYQVIYDVEKEIKDAMSGLLAPEEIEKSSGSAEVRQVFQITKVGSIAGCMVVSGTIHRNDRARVYRGVEVVYTGAISSLKRLKDDAREVQNGFECGIGLEGFEDLREGDVIEAYTIHEVARRIE
jgi:translation initiation factor IF-2